MWIVSHLDFMLASHALPVSLSWLSPSNSHIYLSSSRMSDWELFGLLAYWYRFFLIPPYVWHKGKGQLFAAGSCLLGFILGLCRCPSQTPPLCFLWLKVYLKWSSALQDDPQGPLKINQWVLTDVLTDVQLPSLTHTVSQKMTWARLTLRTKEAFTVGSRGWRIELHLP